MQSRPFPIVLLVLLVAIAVVNGFAEVNSWYWRMKWFDVPMHIAGGVWIAGVVLWWRFFSGRVNALFSAKGAVVWALVGALGVGVGWEVYEGVVALFTKGHLNVWSDTMSDLLCDAIGALAVAGGVALFQKK